MKTHVLITIFILALVMVFSSCKKEEEKAGPVASFSVSPPEGYVTTEFHFDASGTSDEDTPASDLKFRWDWDGDGQWDTQYGPGNNTYHQYQNAGTYDVRLEVMDTDGWTDSFHQMVTVLPDTTPPMVMFSVLPENGDINTIFKFDATNTMNLNKVDGELQIRWDWEGDGQWDTGYREDPQAYHRYIIPGIYEATLEVKDDNNFTNVARITIRING